MFSIKSLRKCNFTNLKIINLSILPKIQKIIIYFKQICQKSAYLNFKSFAWNCIKFIIPSFSYDMLQSENMNWIFKI